MKKLNKSAFGHMKAALNIAGCDVKSLSETELAAVAYHLQKMVAEIVTQQQIDPFAGLVKWSGERKDRAKPPRKTGRGYYAVEMRKRRGAGKPAMKPAQTVVRIEEALAHKAK